MLRDILQTSAWRLVSTIAGFSWTLILVNNLDKSEYGLYSSYLILMSLVPFLLDLGTNNGLIISRDEKDRIEINPFFTIKFIIVTLLVLIITLISLAYNDLLIFLMGVTALVTGMYDSLTTVRISYSNFKLFNLTVPIRNCVNVILGILLLKSLTIQNVMLIVLSAAILQFLTYFYISREDYKNVRVGVKGLKNFLRLSSGLGFLKVAELIMSQSQIVVFTVYAYFNIRSSEEIASFTGAFTLCLALPILANSATKIMLPKIANTNGSSEISTFFNRYFSILALFFVFLTFVIISITHWFFPANYGSSVKIIPIITLSIFVSLLTKQYSLRFLKKDYHMYLFRILMLQIVADILFAFIFIYNFSYSGAAFALLCSRILGFFLYKKNSKKIDLIRNIDYETN